MTKLDEIRNRRLTPTDIAKINAMAEISDPGPEMEDLEDKLPVSNKLEAKTEEKPAVNDVAFYGPRVMEFCDYFSKKDTLWPPHVAATLALAACTLKASVVIGQAITDLKPIQKIGDFPVTGKIGEIIGTPGLYVSPIPAKKKRGRPVGSKKKHA